MEIRAADLLRAMQDGMRLQGDDTGAFSFLPFAPPILQARFDSGEADNAGAPAATALDPAKFEHFADRAHRAFLGEPGIIMPHVRVETLLEAIGMACDRLAAEPGGRGAPDAATRLNMQSGLQLVGVRICASTAVADLLQASPGALRLSNARLPFSLRLIGCVIETPLALSNCQLVTLDLSGSALRGLDATFLSASGSVRLRRTFLVAPADFAGATVHGYFDAGDAIFKPLATPPDAQRLDGDRGMLNLNQARVDNDVQLSRATIWGGLSMRGLHTQRSIHMDEAVILSPLGALEALVWFALMRVHPKFVDANVYGRQQWTEDRKNFHDIVTKGSMPEPQKPQHYVDALQRARRMAALFGCDEFFRLPLADWRLSVLSQLLTHSLRARTSAIRADGVEVGGSIFAQHLRCNGRFRMKYAVVTGGLSLQGARLRSAEAMRRAFDEVPVPLLAVGNWRKRGTGLDGPERSRQESQNEMSRRLVWSLRLTTLLELVYLRLETYFSVVSEEDFRSDVAPPYADAYVLDLRESRFGGSVRIGVPPDDADKPGQPVQHTSIDGVIALQRANIDGELFLDGVVFAWSVRVSDQHPDERAQDTAKTHYAAAPSNSPFRKQTCEDHRDTQIRRGKRHIIEARNVTVTDNVSLTGCENLMGADFRNATISGDFLMLKRVSLEAVAGVPAIVVERPAQNPRGRINLEGVEIAGNCSLMFDGGMITEQGKVRDVLNTMPAGAGPSIEARLARIDGELLIAGHPSPQMIWAGQSTAVTNTHNVLLHSPDLIKANDELVKADWLAAERASACSDPQRSLDKWLDERRAHPKIDLANARAALFTHMPNAWPRLDRLDIVGFRYERAGRFGSLAPLPYVPGTSPAIDTRPRNRRRVGYAIFAIVVSLGLSLGFLAGLDELVGASNLFWTILIFLLLAAQLGLPILTRPFRRHSRPIGLSWLRLQRLARNDSRVQDGRFAGWRGRLPCGPNRQTVAQWPAKSPRGSVYQSLEPYTIAARALREEGRWISANRIEQRRLEVRTGQLSWRLHLFEKVGFSLIGASARYGFSYVRMFFLSAFLLLGTAMIAHDANQRGLMQHKLVKVELHPAAGLNDAQLAYSAKFGHRGHVALDLNIGGAPAGDAAACDKPGGRCEEFNSLAFARDLVLPAVSSGADEEWEAKPGVAVPWLSWLPFTLRELFDIAHLLGLGFFGLLLLGVSARISLLINRYSE